MVVSTSSVPSRRHLALLVVPIAAVTALGALGTALTPYLAVHHPLVLLVLEARDRNLVLARHVALVPYVVVGSVAINLLPSLECAFFSARARIQAPSRPLC